MEVSVAFQGERGAYSELAALQYFGLKMDTLPLRSLLDVFEAVERGLTEYGVVPMENSIEGSVNETYDLLLDSKLKVSGEVYLKVEHCLITHSETRLSGVKKVYSHPQALAQCRSFLNTLKCEAVPSYDTAGSVALIRSMGLKDAAAIASERAAKIYGMKVLRRGIQDSPNNYTRFLILGGEESSSTGEDKTSIIFSTKHIPGALYKALGEFASRNINLTMIVSRPTKTTPWEYNFYVDAETHRADRSFKECLEGLKDKVTFIKILGSYPKKQYQIRKQ